LNKVIATLKKRQNVHKKIDILKSSSEFGVQSFWVKT